MDEHYWADTENNRQLLLALDTMGVKRRLDAHLNRERSLFDNRWKPALALPVADVYFYDTIDTELVVVDTGAFLNGEGSTVRRKPQPVGRGRQWVALNESEPYPLRTYGPMETRDFFAEDCFALLRVAYPVVGSVNRKWYPPRYNGESATGVPYAISVAGIRYREATA